MDEFIKKLIERLASNTVMMANSKEFWDNPQNGEYVSEVIQIEDAISIVNELAEEYNNGFCEQQSEYKFISDKYKRETGCGYTYYDLHHAEPFKFCPYCGKKIKVVE